MKLTQSKVHLRCSRIIGRGVAGTLVILSGIALNLPVSVCAGDGIAVNNPAERQNAEGIGTLSAPDSGTHKGPLKVTKKRAQRKHRSAGQGTSSGQSIIRMQFEGTYEIDFGDGQVIRGQGNTTVQLDGKTMSLAREYLKTLETLPQTVESTAAILKMLSDPATQESLRQVESLLRFIPKSQGPPD